MDRSQILGHLRERILAFATSRVGSQDAEDLVHEALVVLLKKYEHVTELEELVPLAITIIDYKIRDHVRKRSRRKEDQQVPVEETNLPSPAPTPYRRAEQREMLACVMREMSQLPQPWREVICLHLEGLSFPEIARRLDANLNTVYTWERRGRERLLAALEEADRRS